MAVSIILTVFAIGLFNGDAKDQSDVSSGENNTETASLNNTETGLLGKATEKIDNLIVTGSELKEMDEECAQKFRVYKEKRDKIEEEIDRLEDAYFEKLMAGENVSPINYTEIYANTAITFQDIEDIIQCYANISVISGNYSSCENIYSVYDAVPVSDTLNSLEILIRNECYLMVSSLTGDEKICVLLRHAYSDNCYVQISGYHSDFSYCNKIKDSFIKETCIIEAANKDNYKELCYSIKVPINMVKCIVKIAKETNNIEVCDELKQFAVVGIELDLHDTCLKYAS